MVEPRAILHVDMDAFYAAVEQLDDPTLLGRPVIVGGDPDGRGVVSTASYEARRFGVHSAMPMRRALRCCPQAVLRRPRMDRYLRISERIRRIFRAYTPLVEPLSLDEAFLDVTGSERLFGPAATIGREVQARIRRETGLSASVGVAPNMFLAKVASDLRKPEGFVVITRETCQALLDPLPPSRIWGVGPQTERRLNAAGYRTIGQVRCAPITALATVVGAQAEHLSRLAHGLDERPVTPEHVAKSLSCERTFVRDEADVHELRAVLLEQTEQVGRRLRAAGLWARTVTVKLRDGDFRTLTRARSLHEPTQMTERLWAAARTVFDAWYRRQGRPLRLIGVGLSGLGPRGPLQGQLFTAEQEARQRCLDRVMDRVQERYGRQALHREAD